MWPYLAFCSCSPCFLSAQIFQIHEILSAYNSLPPFMSQLRHHFQEVFDPSKSELGSLFCVSISFHYSHILVLFFFFSFYGHTCGIWKFPGQVSNPSHSCALWSRCSNTRSSNLLHRARHQTYTSATAQATAVRSLTHCATEGTPLNHFFLYSFFFCSIYLSLSSIRLEGL